MWKLTPRWHSSLWKRHIPATQTVSENVDDPRNMNYNDLQVLRALVNQSCRKQRCMKGSCVRPEFAICTTASSSHEIWNCTPASLGAQILTAMTSGKNSRAVICEAKPSIWPGKANEIHSLKQVAPPRCNEASHVNKTSLRSHERNCIKAVLLKEGKQVNYQLMSASISFWG